MIVAGNFGIIHDSAHRYVFRFSELVRHNSFDLRLAVFPGTRLTITDIELLVSDGWQKVSKPWFEIESSHAYHDEKGRILLNHRGDQTIAFKLDPKVIVSRSGSNVVAGLAMNAKFERLALSTNPTCQQPTRKSQRFFRRRFLLLPLTALVVALLWAGSAQIYRDWRAGYSTRDVYIQPVNWPLYNAEIYARKLAFNYRFR